MSYNDVDPTGKIAYSALWATDIHPVLSRHSVVDAYKGMDHLHLLVSR